MGDAELAPIADHGCAEIGVVEEIRYEDGKEVRYIRRHKDGRRFRYVQRKDGSWGIPATTPSAPFSAKRLVATKPSQIMRELQEICPWINDLDQAAVERFVRLEARARALNTRLNKMQAEGTPLEDIPAKFWNALRDAEVNAQKFGQDLGLDPTGRQKLLKDAAWTKRLAADAVGDIANRGRELRGLPSGE